MATVSNFRRFRSLMHPNPLCVLCVVLVMWTIFSVYYSNSTWNSFLPMSITEAPMITLEIPHRTCEECLRPHKNSFSMTKALGSFVTHIVCPECRERIQLPDSDPEIHLSVKTANIYHRTRLSLLFFTWMQTVDPDQLYVITDEIDDYWSKQTKLSGIHVLKSNCPRGHNRVALCCKTGFEFEQYYKAVSSGKLYRWFCRFDDDQYLNIRALKNLLKKYNSSKKYYIGHYISWLTHKKRMAHTFKFFPEAKRNTFFYSTGATYCISAALMVEMEKYARGERFVATCKRLKKGDDLSVGAVTGGILGENLTHVPTMLNHLEDLAQIKPKALPNLITVSWKANNTLHIPHATFSRSEDPTRLLSYHCLLYPNTLWCEERRKQ